MRGRGKRGENPPQQPLPYFGYPISRNARHFLKRKRFSGNGELRIMIFSRSLWRTRLFLFIENVFSMKEGRKNEQKNLIRCARTFDVSCTHILALCVSEW